MSRTIGYRSILVPVTGNVETDTALDVSCRLAADHGCTLTALVVIEVPSVLPLRAHMPEEEAEAKRLLRRAQAVGDSYGVRMLERIVRGREPGPAILAEANERRTDLIVLGACRTPRRPFGRTAQSVLKHASCRVLLIAAPPATAVVRTAA